jgi:hypothetical protein
VQKKTPQKMPFDRKVRPVNNLLEKRMLKMSKLIFEKRTFGSKNAPYGAAAFLSEEYMLNIV